MVMQLKCKHVSASEAGDEIFDITFEGGKDLEESPYVLIQRAFFEEEDGRPSPIYLETHDARLIGHYPTLDATLTRNQFVVRLPPPASEIIEVTFKVSDRQYREIYRTLKIILQKDIQNEGAVGCHGETGRSKNC